MMMFRCLQSIITQPKHLLLVTLFFLFIFHSALVTGQEISQEGWSVPDLEGLMPYSITIKLSDGVEKMVERFLTASGRHVARISGNGRVYAYAVDHNEEPPVDYLILDPNGSAKFTHKYGPDDFFMIPEWVSHSSDPPVDQ